MKKLSWINKILYALNSLIATILLLSYLVPYISPLKFPALSILSLAVPFLIVFNFIFLIYWIIKLRRQFLLPLIVLLIGFNTVGAFFRFFEKEILLNDDLKVMSYNVRLFNLYNWKPESKETIKSNIKKFVKEKSPDIVCFQEFVNEYSREFKYKYRFVNDRNAKNKRTKFGQAIFSNYPIINYGSVNFESSTNNAIYADIVVKEDTLRVYNVHLESQKIELDKENFGDENKEKLKIRVQNTFKAQANQAQKLFKNEQECPYKVILCGDFNNTAFSWVYRKLKDSKNDTFIEAGSGFGKSYDYKFPARIDFIFSDKNLDISNFKTYNVKYSDHYPIMARFNLLKKN
jgi:vancomycin resistance protein VanJ